MFKNEIENRKKLKPMGHLNLLIGISIVIIKKKIEIWTKERWYTLVWMDGDLWLLYRIWITKTLECFKELKKIP